MASSSQFTITALLDVQNIKANSKLIQQELISMGERTRSVDFGKAVAGSIDLTNKLRIARQELEKLRILEQQTTGGRRAKNISDPQVRDLIKAQQTGAGAQGQNATAAVVGKAIDVAVAKVKELEAGLLGANGVLLQLADTAGSSMSKVRQETQAAIDLLNRAQQLTTGGGAQRGVQLGQAKGLDAEIEKIQKQMQELNNSAAHQGTDRQLKAYQAIPPLIAKANKARDRALQLTLEIAAIEQKIAGRSTGTNKHEQDRIDQLTAERAAAQQAERDLLDRAAKPQSQQDTRMAQAGTAEAYAELEKRLGALIAKRRQLFDPQVIARDHPELHKQIQLVEQLSKAYQQGELSVEEQALRLKQLTAETEKLDAMQKKAAESAVGKGRGAYSAEDQAANLAKMRPGIDRLMSGIFSDMSRRFVATLQFTISAAIIFGAQRLAKEFIQAAIEVERAFADISSALEFDIEAGRGTAEFNREVQKVRVQVLQLANDYNILPAEANEAAYVMISRFKDTGNAMTALRAQLLATKVSGIEQGEVLRALTAIAEGFAGAIFDSTEALSLQDKLLKRETISARLYGEALDLAVQIQQRYGVETEDTLEGTARATEVFRQMGFTMNETAAIVAGTTRQLGQTGQQIAERLNRSIGQLTDPKIREALLDLAATSEEFSLSVSDFGSGADAWKAITDQFARLEKSSPQVAGQILQIVGQRRELEAVAAALGTADLQEEIVANADSAAGAAEDRFAGLAKTMDEILKSIAANFQSLAQNFQTLGGLTSIKLLILGLDQILASLAGILEMFIWLKDTIDSVLPFPFASWLVQGALLTASLAGAVRVTLSLVAAFKELTKWQAISNLLGKVGASGAVASAGGTFGTKALATGQIGGVLKGAAGAGLGALAAPLATTGGALAAVAVAAVSVAYGFKQLSDTAAAMKKSFEDGKAAMQDAAYAARESAEAQGLSDRETEIAVLEARRDAARSAQQAAGSGSGGLFAGIASLFKDSPIGQTGRIGNAIYDRDFGSIFQSSTLDYLSTKHNPQNVKGSKEWYANIIDELNTDLLNNLIDDYTEANSQVQSDIDVSDLDTQQLAGLAAEQNSIQSLYDLAAEKIVQANETGLGGPSQAQRDALFSEATALLTEGNYRYQKLMDTYGTVAQEMNDSVGELKKKLGNLDTDIKLGFETTGSAAQFAEDAAARLLALSEKYRENDLTSAADDALADSRDAQIQAMELRAEALERDVTNATYFLDNRAAIRKEIEVRAEALRNTPMMIDGHINPEWGIIYQGWIDAVGALVDADEEAMRAHFDHQIAMAKTFEESIAARRELLDEIYRQIQSTSDGDDQDALTREWELLNQGIVKDTYDQKTKELVSLKRLSGPIMSPLVKLQSDVIEQQRILNSAFSSYADKLAAQVSLKEIYAQMQVLELDRLRALTLATVSVRDSMNSLHVEIAYLRRVAQLAAEQYGRTSKEYADAVRAVESSEAAMIDMVLELESANRQLDPNFDVTDPLQAAEENYIKIARQLQIPDLGDVEKAALELQLKNAEAQRIQAAYNSRLFELKFMHESGQLGTNAYIDALKGMLAEVDTSTYAGKQMWIQINSLIEGLTSDISGQAFNIPGQIRIPTLFEVRRAVQAEALGVNYQDNRQQDINVYVSDNIQLDVLMETISSVFEVEQARFAPGGAGITLGAN